METRHAMEPDRSWGWGHGQEQTRPSPAPSPPLPRTPGAGGPSGDRARPDVFVKDASGGPWRMDEVGGGERFG